MRFPFNAMTNFPALVRLCSLALSLFVAACQPAPTAAPSASLATSMPKLLATVYISPTPNEAEMQATRAVSRPTETPIPETPTATPTVYIGVFLGESGSLNDGVSLNVELEEPTAAPRDEFAACPMQPDERFGAQWRQAGTAVTTLGCPAGVPIPYTGTSQIFENGVMYFTPDGEIWAIAPGSPSGRYWYAPQAPDVVPSEAIVAPEGLRVPTLGFGAFWYGIGGVREALGFARAEEQATTFNIQQFQNGTLLLDNSAAQVFILISTGSEGPAYGPY